MSGRGLLPVYRMVGHLLHPAIPFLLKKRERRGKEDPHRVGERLGNASLPRPDGALIWVHGASVGELISVLPLVDRMKDRATVLVTSGTVTSAEIAAQRLPAGVLHQYAPIDTPTIAERFIRHWRPDLSAFVESELWPNLIAAARTAGSKLAIANGRMSEKSAATWSRFPRTIRGLLSNFDVCAAQSDHDAARFAALGAPLVEMYGNLKFDAAPLPVDEAAHAELTAQIGQRPVFLAASTHPGEEEVVIAAHLHAAAAVPDLLTIIAPRHPARGEPIAATARSAGLNVAVRSLHEALTARTNIYVANTVGELGLFYRLARFAFVGGSFAEKGGQNPIEPAKLGVGVLHGPSIYNFRDIYPLFDTEGAALRLDEPDALGPTVAALLNDPAKIAALSGAITTVSDRFAGATQRTADALLALLPRGGA